MKERYSRIAFAIMAVGIMTACTSNEVEKTAVEAQSFDNAVTFGTYVGKTGSTRSGDNGAITTTANLQASDGIGVFAYNTGTSTLTSGTAFDTHTPNFMYNQLVKYNSTSTKWEYSPLKYWPNGIDAGNTSGTPSKTATEESVQNLSFFAYAPYVELTSTALTSTGITAINGYNKSGSGGSNGNKKAGDPTVTYKLAGNFEAASNVDLLWGLAGVASYNEADNTDPSLTVGTSYNVNLTKSDVDDMVTFQFKHALAKIGGISAVLDIDANTEATALSGTTCVTIQNVTITNDASKLCTGGVFDLATGTWSSTSLDAAANAVTSTITTSTSNYNNAVIYAASSSTYATGTSTWTPLGVTNTAKSLYSDGNAPEFFLIPQIANQVLKISVTYEVATYDANVDGNYVRTSQTITNNVTLPALETNKSYSLVLHLGLTSVKFSATVADWGSGTTSEIWLPSNVVE